MLEVDDLSVSFGGVRAVDSVGFAMSEATTLGLVGPNGSGKTTLVNALTGMVAAAGRVRVGGTAMRLGRPGESYRLGVVRTYQTPRVFASLTCLENLALAMSPRKGTGLIGAVVRRRSMLRAERERWARAEQLLSEVGLESMADVASGELSYGRQRILELARCLAAVPRLILLDEPAAGLNQAETDELADIIAAVQRQGIGVLLIEHKIDFVTRLCPTIVVLELGRKIAEGPPAEVFADRRVMDAYLGAVHDA